MATGKAAVLDKPMGTFRLEEFRVPEPEPGTVLLRQELAGCCATDAHTYLGQWPADFPVIMGHENVGIVEAIGAGGAVDFMGRALRVGDRVIARTSFCGACYECRSARRPRRCLNLRVRYGFSSAEDAPLSGGYGEYLYLSSPQTTFMLKVQARPSIAALARAPGRGRACRTAVAAQARQHRGGARQRRYRAVHPWPGTPGWCYPRHRHWWTSRAP